jgi:hypothetical protein
MCSFAIAGLPDLPWDFLHQKSRNFLSLHRITVSGLTRISSHVQSLQILDSNDQNSRSLFLSIGFFDMRLYTMSCCLSTRDTVLTVLPRSTVSQRRLPICLQQSAFKMV